MNAKYVSRKYSNAGWIAFYLAVFAWLLSFVMFEQPRLRSEVKPKPEASTCTAPEGWSAVIEPAEGGGWACVLRSGKKTKAFFYGGAR